MLKVQYGHTIPDTVAPDESIDATSFGDNSHRPISRRRLADVINARAEELLELILREIKRSGYDGLLPAGVVLCGGTANLAGIKDLGREVLGLPVRIGAPHDLEGLVDTVKDPAYACSVGLLLWGARNAPDGNHDGSRRGLGILGRFRHLMSVFTPG
jgi:cell division protein FtsA